jgi:hypothetical protein
MEKQSKNEKHEYLTEEEIQNLTEFFALFELPFFKDCSVSSQFPLNIPDWALNCYFCKKRKINNIECPKIKYYRDLWRRGRPTSIGDCPDYDEDPYMFKYIYGE